jgi:arylsulfatase A-like enzyme
MRRRDFLTAGLAAGVAPSGFAASKPPNIVYVLADDLGTGDLGCYNPRSDIPTPHADRLAREGVRFTDMHSPSAVCTPTRYGIMTGRYCWRSRLKKGVLWGYDTNLIEPGRTTVASLLRSRGYRTAGFGKWHLGLGSGERVDYSKPLRPGPLDHGFDYYFGIPASLDMEPYLYFENDRVIEQPTAHTPGQNKPRGVFWRPGPIAPSLRVEDVLPEIRRRAVGYIAERARQPEQPFFLYLPLTSPHTPWLPSAAFAGKSKAGDYGDFAAETDDVLGSVMRALDEHRLANNTLLIFTSDNGADWTPQDKERFAHRANGRWRGRKRDIYEAGHRIPFIARWPGTVKAGSVSDQLGCLTDLIRTAAEITGAQIPRDAAEDSVSLLAALKGTPRRPLREAVVHHSSEGMFAIRQGRWKLVLGRGSGGNAQPPDGDGPAGQLFDLAADPEETQNLYLRESRVVARLTALLEKYQREGRST